MFFFAGLIRSTVLYLIPISLLNGNSKPFDFIMGYVIVSLIHIIVCKLSDKHCSASDIFLGAFQHDLSAPFLEVKSCLEVLLKKYIIQDTPEHMFEDKMQVYLGGVWGVCILVLLCSNFIG